jgi:2-C-methyl-D-erythritol 4-phosphate cytidylyltransferase
VTVWGIVVAGGKGTRFGSPKQFERLGDARVVDRAVAAAVAACEQVIVVVPPGIKWDGDAAVMPVIGGERRSDSVRAGLAVVGDDAEIVVVHDAARPLAQVALFREVIDAVRRGADAAVPVVPLADTLKRIDGARVRETVPREQLVSAQTPQAFRTSVLRAAHAPVADAADDAALVEAAGGTVVATMGDPRNIKVTTGHDLDVAAALLESWRAGSR